MDSRLKKVALWVGLVAVIVFGVAGFLTWRSVAYVDTYHARMMGNVEQVSSPVAGRVGRCDLETGDMVAEHEELLVIEAKSANGTVALPLRAPISGLVVARNVESDDMIAAGQPLMTLADPVDVWVEANINESRIAHVKVGQTVRVRVQALKVSLPGTVVSVSGATNNALQADGGKSAISIPGVTEVPVRIAVDAKGYNLYPGLSVQVRIRVDPRAW